MKTIKVHMLAFMDGEIRNVRVNELEWDDLTEDVRLGLVYRNGQNCFQPVDGRCSVSVGDVIEMDGKYHVVMPIGFDVMTPEEFELYKHVERRRRVLYVYERRERKEQKVESHPRVVLTCVVNGTRFYLTSNWTKTPALKNAHRFSDMKDANITIEGVSREWGFTWEPMEINDHA